MNLPAIENVPKSMHVKTELLEILDSGEYPPGKKLPTEPELSTLFKVSRNTVREAISSLVYEGRLIRRQGRGTFAAEAKTDQSIISSAGVVGLCYSLFAYNRELIRQCQEYLLEKDGLLVLYDISEDLQNPVKEENFLNKAAKENFQGVILIPTPFEPSNRSVYRRLRKQGVKVALLAAYQDDMSDEVFFMPDFRQAGYMVTAKMAVAGCRQVVMARGGFPIFYQWMKAGMTEAAKDLGLEVIDDLVFKPWDRIFQNAQNNYPEIKKVLKRLPEATGIISTQWEAGRAIYEMLKDVNRSIPDEIRLCSWYSHVPAGDPGISYLHYSNQQMLMDAIDYVLDSKVSSTDLVQKWYSLTYEERGTVQN